MKFKTWKLRREIHRIRQQLAAIPEFFSEPVRRHAHDRRRKAMLHARHGQAPVRKKLALFLIYQPTGISDATIWTCQHLVAKGYSPLVVSNSPVSPQDVERITPWAWRIVERPNFGYDFGGYRDGIWLLNQWKTSVDTLIILNDSIWFPLYSDETLIEQMEDSTADFVGALQLDPIRGVDGLPPRKRPFFGSFFLMLKRGALENPVFGKYWNRYRITSNKYKTIRRGERDFSHTLMNADVSSRAIYTRHDLDRYIASLPNAALRECLADLVTIDDRIERKISQCIADFEESTTWRSNALRLAISATEKQNVLATAPMPTLTVFKVPYLKKSRDWNNLKALAIIRDRMRSGRLREAHPDILKDIDKVLSSRQATTQLAEPPRP